MVARNGPDEHEDPAVLTKQEARQGSTEGVVRWVLIIGTALAVIAMLIIYFAVF